MSEYADKWIVVSGASSGIGRAIAIELAARGARVALLGRDAARLAGAAEACAAAAAAAGHGAAARSESLALDLSALDAIGPAIQELVQRTGRIYGLCHSAGVVQTLPLAATRPDRAAAMLNVNLLAGLELARALTRRDVLEPDGGSLLYLASVYAHVGAPGQIAYCATKGAVVAAVRAMALEFAARRIRVNSVSPGMVRTAMTSAEGSQMSTEQWAQIAAKHPLGTGLPEDVARAAAFLLSPVNGWITGADLVIDGGYTLQ